MRRLPLSASISVHQRLREKVERTSNLHVVDSHRLISPKQLKELLPSGDAHQATVVASRHDVTGILGGRDQRLLVVVGPCSIHDTKAALEYATRLSELRKQVEDKLSIVMRVYFEKPRTTIGWKGLI